MIKEDLLQAYINLLHHIEGTYCSPENEGCLKKEYALLFYKVFENSSACIVLIQGVQNYIERSFILEAEMIFRSILESIIHLKYLLKHPGKLEDYKDNAFIERLKDIAKGIEYGFFQEMDHEKLLNESELLFKARGLKIKRTDILDFNKINNLFRGKENKIFPEFRECIKDLKESIDNLEVDKPPSEKYGLSETYLLTYSFSSQMIHSNPLTISEYYYGECLFRKPLYTEDQVLRQILHFLIVSCEEIDHLLTKSIGIKHTVEFKKLSSLLYPEVLNS